MISLHLLTLVSPRDSASCVLEAALEPSNILSVLGLVLKVLVMHNSSTEVQK